VLQRYNICALADIFSLCAFNLYQQSQENLIADDYKILMMDDLEDLNCHRLRALENIEANKLRITKYYDKKVKAKQFHEGALVWKLILPIGTKDGAYGKWSPNWEGPY
jgi:hypothetical protein